MLTGGSKATAVALDCRTYEAKVESVRFLRQHGLQNIYACSDASVNLCRHELYLLQSACDMTQSVMSAMHKVR